MHLSAKVGLIFLNFILVISCRSFPNSQEGSLKDDATSSGIYKLTGTSSNLDPGELRPLAKLIEASSFIALGEGSHGTIEFSSIRTSFVKLLVEEYGVRAIGFEMPWDDANPVEKYVQTCTGNPPYFWWGQTVELQKYLCDFNQRHPNDKVHVYGFDTNIREGAIDRMKEFVQDIDDSQLNTVNSALQVCKYSGNPPRSPSNTQLSNCINTLSSIINLITNNEQIYKAKLGTSRFIEAKILFTALKWMNQDMQNRGSEQSTMNVRDAGMANLAIQWRQFMVPNKKVVLWADNSHTQKKRSACLMRTKLPQNQIDKIRQALAQNPSFPVPPEIDLNTMTYSKLEDKSMGEYLHDSFGSAYTAIATLGYEVNAKSVKGLPDGTIDRTPVKTIAESGSMQFRIHSAYPGTILYADFPNSIFNASSTQIETTAGAVGYSHIYKPIEQYDGIFFLDKVRESP